MAVNTKRHSFLCNNTSKITEIAWEITKWIQDLEIINGWHNCGKDRQTGKAGRQTRLAQPSPAQPSPAQTRSDGQTETASQQASQTDKTVTSHCWLAAWCCLLSASSRLCRETLSLSRASICLPNLCLDSTSFLSRLFWNQPYFG